MTEIRITEGVPEPPTWSPEYEPNQSLWEVAYLNDWARQDLPDYIASRPPLLDCDTRFLGNNSRFDEILTPYYKGSLAFVVSPDEIPGQFHSIDHIRIFGDVYNDMRDLYTKRAEQIHFPTLENSTTPPASLSMYRFFFADTFKTPSYRENPLLYSVRKFALGLSGIQPDYAVVEMAERIVWAVHDFTLGSCITIDDEGGELDLQLRLNNGLLVMANLFPDGTIDASVYDDSQGIPVKTVKRMKRSTTSESELITLFRAGFRASTT